MKHKVKNFREIKRKMIKTLDIYKPWQDFHTWGKWGDYEYKAVKSIMENTAVTTYGIVGMEPQPPGKL